ncbi:MAG TPA: response regulator transcription factor [Chloroflexota bacterium]|nr:response regulator transcription factor [Chloroflexota bacterium]
MAEILLAEDNASHRMLAQFVLETQGGHRVRTSECALSTLRELDSAAPDLLVLDAQLPGQTGIDLCRQLRRGAALPILIVSSRGDPADRVVGLRAGADDYLPKPFDPSELVERVNALLRRARRSEGQPTGTVLRAGEFRLNLVERSVRVRERGPIALTPAEVRLLYAMLTKPGAVWTRDELRRRLWDGDAVCDGAGNAVEVHISNLRRKLEVQPKRPVYLITVRGEGYELRIAP